MHGGISLHLHDSHLFLLRSTLTSSFFLSPILPFTSLRLVNLLMRTGRSVALLFLVLVECLSWKSRVVEAKPRRIVLDTDMDTDDFFALLYLLKQNPSQFDLKAITISANSWSDAGHAVNHVYDILYMMNRDDIPVGVGGDGGILDDGTILPHVGGYLPLIEQGMSTAGDCRYRQAIPVGSHGRLDVNTNYGLRRSFLPQPQHCDDKGNLFTGYTSNPYAEFNMFADPFAAYQVNIHLMSTALRQVFHAGIPVTLVPLDSTNTIPINQEFFDVFQQQQETFEAQYCFKSLKIIRDNWVDDDFYTVSSS
ncbi:hypothetical protein BHM03_00018605 [Ensete ventricosum]|nr:hypothetical protein BHM03_00018605 [Ensete ventricosum]